MLKIENSEVFGWEAAIRGMRNPMNSWDKSDSGFGCAGGNRWPYCGEDCRNKCYFILGENDLKLMKSLSKAGSDHAKFLRMINVTCDITAPLYFFKEWDTYKVGVVANSTSTMHKIHAKEFTLDDFSHEHLMDSGLCLLENTIESMNFWRLKFIEQTHPETRNVGYMHAKECWWQMIQLLPSSYNQKRTVQLNYQVLKSMYFARKDHKLDEWHTLCDWMLQLPYFKEICVDV